MTIWSRATGVVGCSPAALPLRARRWALSPLRAPASWALCCRSWHEWRLICGYRAHRRAKEATQADRCDLQRREAGSYDETTPFVKADPFGTDTLNCYVRFATTDLVTVSYEVAGRRKSDDAPKVAAFSRTPHGGDAPTTEHEFKVIGLIPSHKNTVTLTCTAQDGTSHTSTFAVKTTALKGEEEERLTIMAGESNTPLADTPSASGSRMV